MVMQGSLSEVQRKLMPHREAVVTLLDKADEAAQFCSALKVW